MIQQTPFHDSSVKSSYAFLNKKVLTERKRNGVFYTPERATQILSQWAIRKPDDIVFEPSFGGCGFLVASRNRLIELGNNHPEQSLYGCDTDDNAFAILADLFANPNLETHFKKRDYLTTLVSEFPLSDVTIGNPPYISQHNMSVDQRDIVRSVAVTSDISINGKASLWVYFILHSLAFIKPGGRMAWILPGSFIYADYSELLRHELAKQFNRCLAVFLEDRIFLETGTEESSVILLCEGYKSFQSNHIEFASVRNLTGLEDVIQHWSMGAKVGDSMLIRPQLAMVPVSIKNCYLRILGHHSAHRFTEFADIKIGLVTGANKFFVLNQNQVDKNELPEGLIEPILAKFSQSRGLSLTNEDLQLSRQEGHRCLLVNSLRCKQQPKTFKDYLETFPEKERAQNYTFTKTRSVWYQVDDNVRPDGFFSSMQSNGPTLVLNSARTTCTNTVYQVTFLLNLAERIRKVLAVSIQSTFSQFSAEVEGRIHGGGALKLEPSEVKKLAVLLPEEIYEIENVFNQVDSLLREGDRVAARRVADAFLIAHNVVSREDLQLLEEGLQTLRSIRSGHRKEATV